MQDGARPIVVYENDTVALGVKQHGSRTAVAQARRTILLVFAFPVFSLALVVTIVHTLALTALFHAIQRDATAIGTNTTFARGRSIGFDTHPLHFQ